MWRWIIRVYVSLVVFCFLVFFSGALLMNVTRGLARAGFPALSYWIHTHVLLTMFSLGVTAGQVVLGANFTGRGWFRSKDRVTYEGFKLEKIKPWTLVIVSPLLLLGIAVWFLEQSEAGVFYPTLRDFYQGFLMPNCTNARLVGLGVDVACATQLLIVGTWMASLGYSLAPIVRKRGSRLLHKMRGKDEIRILPEKRKEDPMKEKTKLQ